jgi:hypothetical protein
LAEAKTHLPPLVRNVIVNELKNLRDLFRPEFAKVRWFEAAFAGARPAKPDGNVTLSGPGWNRSERICLQLALLGRVFLFVTGASVLGGCCSLPAQTQQTHAVEPKPKWHSIVMTPRTNLPAIHFYDKLNPIWWFGNVDEPRAPAWYRPNARTRNFTWYLRNPYSNFSNYVIGIADKESVRSGRYPDKVGNPRGGWNFAVSSRCILFLPFIDYKHGRFEFYSGWRERGNFGMKLNFREKLSEPPPQNHPASPPAVQPKRGDIPKSSPDSKPGPAP